MESRLPNFKELTPTEGKIYGTYTTVTSVNPFACYFMVKYPSGGIKRGKDLFETGWDDIPNGFTDLSYILSTGHIISIPKYKAYLPLIECSMGMDKSRVFHAINVKCLDDHSIVVWRIILKQTPDSKYKIGDVIVSREPLPNTMSDSWKYTS